VFVGRLPADTTEGDLRDYFSTFGPLEDVYIPKAPHSAQHRGFGFVTFTR
jgi:RNA-binding protein Musashi